MAGFNHIKRCLELADRDIAFAMEDRLVCKALLDRLAIVSKPSDGGPKILLIFARMASQACDWIDGDLRIEVAGDGDASVIEVLTDLGAGMRERVFGSLRFNIPLDELTRAVERVPHMIEPLTIAVKTAKKVILSATEEVRKSTMPPPMVEIDRESLFDQDLRAPAMPTFAYSLPPPVSKTPEPTKAPDAMKTPDPMKTPEPAKLPDLGGALSRPKIQIVKKGDAAAVPAKAPIVVKAPAAPAPASATSAPNAPSLGKMPIVVKSANAGAPNAGALGAGAASAGAPKAGVPSVNAAPKFAVTPPPAAKNTSSRPSPPAQAGKSQRPKAPSKPPRTALSEPPDEETIDTGWDEDEG